MPNPDLNRETCYECTVGSWAVVIVFMTACLVSVLQYEALHKCTLVSLLIVTSNPTHAVHSLRRS